MSAQAQALADPSPTYADIAAAAERLEYQAIFATDDQKEGKSAFVEKRPPGYQNS